MLFPEDALEEKANVLPLLLPNAAFGAAALLVLLLPPKLNADALAASGVAVGATAFDPAEKEKLLDFKGAAAGLGTLLLLLLAPPNGNGLLAVGATVAAWEAPNANAPPPEAGWLLLLVRGTPGVANIPAAGLGIATVDPNVAPVDVFPKTEPATGAALATMLEPVPNTGAAPKVLFPLAVLLAAVVPNTEALLLLLLLAAPN